MAGNHSQTAAQRAQCCRSVASTASRGVSNIGSMLLPDVSLASFKPLVSDPAWTISLTVTLLLRRLLRFKHPRIHLKRHCRRRRRRFVHCDYVVVTTIDQTKCKPDVTVPFQFVLRTSSIIRHKRALTQAEHLNSATVKLSIPSGFLTNFFCLRLPNSAPWRNKVFPSFAGTVTCGHFNGCDSSRVRRMVIV